MIRSVIYCVRNPCHSAVFSLLLVKSSIRFFLRSITMEDKYFDVYGVPTRVLSYGGTDSKKEMILIIPGNPGMTEFYVDFMKILQTKLKMPVWVVSHAGHELAPNNGFYPPLKGNGSLYDLTGQMNHKKEFICKYVPENIKINLIGHSIGCKIILDLLKEEKVNYRVNKSILLFPTIERLAETPNGKFFVRMNTYFHWILIWLMSLLKYLPNVIKSPLIQGYSKLTNIPLQYTKTICDLINPMVLEKVYFMAQDEMKSVKMLDCDTITKNINKIYLYYGSTDEWCPKEYYEDIKNRIPEVKAQLCQSGCSHAFVLRHAEKVADVVAGYIGVNSSSWC